MGAEKDNNHYSDEETVRRRDEALKRVLNKPPKHQSEMKLGKCKPKAKATLQSRRKTK